MSLWTLPLCCPDGDGRKRSPHAEPEAVAAVAGGKITPDGGAKEPRIVVPGTAAKNAGLAVAGYPRRAIRRRPGIGSQDLQHLADFLGLGKFHLVASAAGGSIASDYAFSHPDRLLSLTVSSNSFGIADGGILAAAMRIRPRIWDEIPVEFRELGPSYRAANPDGFRLWVELERKSQVGDGSRQPLANRITEASLGGLKVPTLVISGDADLSTPPSIARMIAARIANSELVVVPESGHSVYWEQPEAFNRAVLDFIAKHRG